jgi:hypothetical protein
MDAELELLEKLAAANPRVLARIERREDEYCVELMESPAWMDSAWMGSEERRRIAHEHTLRYVFPRYYPSLPLEAYVAQPVLHPNVDPANGFVCLWRSYRAAQTIVDAVLITRAVLSWNAVNDEPEHRMQSVQGLDALAGLELIIPDECRLMVRGRGTRQRLEACAIDCVL